MKRIIKYKYPILEFDRSKTAIIEPSKVIKREKVPEHCVLCFFDEVIQKVIKEKKAKTVARRRWETGFHYIYEIKFKGKKFAISHPGVGAPYAAGMLEELIATGCRKFIACGGAGVLDRKIAVGHIIVPQFALRDEGTSYHYLPASRFIKMNSKAFIAITNTLTKNKFPYFISKTWTTDGPYRETASKIKARRKEGCLTVEMEAAAMFAVAQFRKVIFGQILYGGDDVSGVEWDTRKWYSRRSVREQLFWLAAEACLVL